MMVIEVRYLVFGRYKNSPLTGLARQLDSFGR